MLHKAKENNSETPYLLGDIHTLPFESNSFDVVMTIRLFQHLPQTHTINIINEVRRVIYPGGKFIFDTLSWSPRATSPNSFEGMHVYSLSKVREIIASCGLREVKSISSFLFSAIWYRKLPLWTLKGFDKIEKLLPPSIALAHFLGVHKMKMIQLL